MQASKQASERVWSRMILYILGDITTKKVLYRNHHFRHAILNNLQTPNCMPRVMISDGSRISALDAIMCFLQPAALDDHAITAWEGVAGFVAICALGTF